MISVVVPAYQEQEAITGVIEELRRALADFENVEILVVDDGSDDETAAHARAAGATVLSHPCNQGYGAALRTGILAATHPVIAIVDADGTYPAEEIPRLVAELDKGFDLVVGQRTGPHFSESLGKRTSRYLFRWIAEFVAGRRIPDINSGMRVFRRDAILPMLDQLCVTFSFSTSMTLTFLLQGRFVQHLPIAYRQRTGESKVHMVRDTLRAAQILVQTILRYNPIKFFLLGMFANLLLAGAALLGYAFRPGALLLSLGNVFLLLAGVSLIVGFLVVALQPVTNPRSP